MFALRFLIWMRSAKAHATVVMLLFLFDVFTTGVGLSIEWQKMTGSVLGGLEMSFFWRTVFAVAVSGALSFALTFTVSTLSESFSFGLIAISATSSAFSAYAFRNLVINIDYSNFTVSDGISWLFMVFIAIGPLIMMKVNSSKAMRGFGAEIAQLLTVENREIKAHFEKTITDRVNRMKEQAEASKMEAEIGTTKRQTVAQRALDRLKKKPTNTLEDLLRGTGVTPSNN